MEAAKSLDKTKSMKKQKKYLFVNRAIIALGIFAEISHKIADTSVRTTLSNAKRVSIKQKQD